MTVSNDIRALAAQGIETAEIARRLGIRYQHAYNVLKRSASVAESSQAPSLRSTAKSKPDLAVGELLARGFAMHGRWILGEDSRLSPDLPLPKDVGVYAFARGDTVQYVGVATMGLAKRIYFYGRPGVTQRTSLRVNALIRDELAAGASIDIYLALPPDLEWNGLPVHGSAGLELGIIKKFRLPWNMRSAA